MQDRQHDLVKKGVRLPSPQNVEMDASVATDRVAAGATIHAGCKIYGDKTLICKDAVVGYEAPATVENCYIGPEVALKGGYYKDAVFLKGASVGSGAQVREGTIFEEYASAAHCVGVKQTILFPFVTLGSLVNFCDCLMAGGTGRKNHSEVGSSYIHFNFTPQQDKATASLIGDVANGVMLNQPPIFLGGQGGLVGPCRLAYGTVVAAGTIHRKDESRPGRLIFGGAAKAGNVAYPPAMYRNIKRVVYNNLCYIANLMALRQWYAHVRSQFISEALPAPLFEGLKHTLNAAVEERLKRMRGLSEKMTESARVYRKTGGENVSQLLLDQKRQFNKRWKELESRIRDDTETELLIESRDRFLQSFQSTIDSSGKNDYIEVIQSMDGNTVELGSHWLQQIIDNRMARWFEMLPAFDG